MGGTLSIDLAVVAAADDAAMRDGARLARRVTAWAARLTRFETTSDLSRLNADPGESVTVGPTLATVLDWANHAGRISGGIVDVTLLAQRLAAEEDSPAEISAPLPAPSGDWQLSLARRGGELRRPPNLAFDLDGVAKGWLADRALRLLRDYSGAIVDADGDLAIRVAPGDIVDIGVADPRHAGDLLTVLRLVGRPGGSTFGLATSGITVHRWSRTLGRSPSHHLIDPRTRRPAETDVLQATVLASTAAEAEILAKAAVILGRDPGIAFLEAANAKGAVLVTAGGECVGTIGTIPYLVAA